MIDYREIRAFFYKNGYLLLTAAWLITIAFLINNYWLYYSSPKGVRNSLEKSIQHREAAFNRMVNNDDLMQQLLSRNYSSSTVENLSGEKTGYYFFVFNEDWEVFWNTNNADPHISPRDYKEGAYFFTNDSSDYELIKKNIGGLYPGQHCVIGLIPIKEKFFITNKYLPDQYVGRPGINPDEYSLNRDGRGLPVHNLAGNVLFYINYHASYTKTTPSAISTFFLLIASLCVLIFINLIASFITQKTKPWYGFAFLFAIILILRLLSYYYAFPFNYHNFPLFDPRIYASSFILRSLGDVLINVLLIFWLILFFREHFKHLRMPKLKPAINFLLTVVFCFALFYVGQAFSDLVRSLVIDSKISFDVTNFFLLNIYSVVGFIALGFIAYCFFFFSQTINKYLNQLTYYESNRKYTFLAICGVAWLAFRFNNPYLGYSVILMIWLLIYIILLDWIDTKLSRQNTSVPNILWLVILTVMTTAILLYNNNQREMANRLIIAERIAKPNDIVTETFLGDLSKKIQQDSLIDNFFRIKTVRARDHLVAYLQSEYFNSYLSKFDLNFYFFNAQYKPLFNPDTASYSILRNIMALHSEPVTTNLFYHESSFGHYHYIGRKIIPVDSSSRLYGGYLFYELSPKMLKTETLYPALLSQDNNLPIEYSDIYSYAVYDNQQLVAHYNDYPFSVKLDFENIPKGEYVFKNGNGYSQLWYKASPGRVVLVVKRSRLFIEAITLFAYLFCLFLIISGVYRCMILLIKARMRWINFKALLDMNIRKKVHSTIIFIVIFSFLILGATTIYFFINRYDKNHRDRLAKNVNVLALNIKNNFANNLAFNNVESLSNPEFINRLRKSIYDMGDIHGVDINLYDVDGTLQISTEQMIFDKGLLSVKMDPEAYYQLHFLNKIQFIHPETIGKLKYLSSYVPILNTDGAAIAYLNVPYFASQNDLNQEISNFLIVLINLNAFIFLLSGLLAVVITNSITRSFTLIGEKLKQLNFGKTNEEVQWRQNDEIGLLVNEYNKMVKKLEVSAQALAKSEREGAWREMARQVAHEIKNPLTPMKLSLQYLQRAIKNNAANVKELSAAVANTLIEQIEHLSQIASDFSAFARISGNNKEQFSLNEVLSSVVNLYQGDERNIILYEEPPEIYLLHADKTEINRLFTNLLQNAVQAIPENRRGFIEITVADGDGIVRIMIEDNGTGIPEDIRTSIFMPNFTTKNSGTGLGLAMCKNIVEQASGKIWFETIENNGTTFFVELPVVENEVV